jgi:hypothetical protein
MLRPVPAPITDAILELAELAGPNGVAMGTVVDALEAQGFAPAIVEREIWTLLERRKLTPNGFVCRTIKRRGTDGKPAATRIYEFMLVPWSSALDQQLDLALERAP